MENLNYEYLIIALLIILICVLIFSIIKKNKLIKANRKILYDIDRIISSPGFKIRVKDYQKQLESYPMIFEKIIVFKIHESIREMNDVVKKNFINFVKITGENNYFMDTHLYFIKRLFEHNIKDEDLHELMYSVLLHDTNLYSGDKIMPYFNLLIGEEKFKQIDEKFRYLNGLNSNDKQTNEKVKEELSLFKKFISYKEKK